MTRGIRSVVLGIFILMLAMVLWNVTGSFWGWAVLFVPGSVYTLIGMDRIIRQEDF